MMTKKPIVLETEGLGDKRFHGRVVRGTEAVEDSGLCMFQIRQSENDLATRRFPVFLAHAGGLHAADMHK